MSIASAFGRFWPLVLPVLFITGLAAFILDARVPETFTATGTVMVARPEVDPSRAASSSVDLGAAIRDASTMDARTAVLERGGRDDYRIVQVSANRAQVLATGDGAIPGVRAVLRALSDGVASQQLAASIAVDERIQPRLFVQVPEDDLEALAAVDAPIDGDPPEVVGTLVLEDPLAGAENPLGGPALATRLVLLSINSDAGTQSLEGSLPEGVAFQVNAFDRRAREILTVSTTGPDQEETLASFSIVTEAVADELERRQEQAEVPSEARLLVDLIAAPLQAQENEPALIRAATIVLVLGLLVAVALPTMLSEFLFRGRAPDSGQGDGKPVPGSDFDTRSEPLDEQQVEPAS